MRQTRPLILVACLMLLMVLAAVPDPAGAQQNGGESAASSALKEKAGHTITALAAAARQFKLGGSAEDLQLRADRMELDYEAGRLAYSGSVRLTHGEALLETEELVFRLEPDGETPLRSAKASGGVKITRGKQTASGRQAYYNHSAGTVTLEGNARLGSGSDSLLGERVVVHLAEGRTVVEGGAAPVRARLEAGGTGDKDE